MKCDLFIAFYQFSRTETHCSGVIDSRSNCFLPNTQLLTPEWVLTNKLLLTVNIHSPIQNFSFAMNKSQFINYFTLQDTRDYRKEGKD